ncbi:MAG: hypothetical protein WKF68_10845 [Daejeonella sp.]
MNNVFNASRFGQLFRKQTVENYRNYLISVVVLFGMLAVFYFLFVLGIDVRNAEMRKIGLYIFYVLAGCIFTSSIFSDYGQKRKAISSLTLPTSHFEKFLVGWMYSFLIYTIIYCLVYAAVDYTFIPFSEATDKRSLIKLLSDEGFPFSMFVYFAFLHSMMLYGALYFRSVHFIKTASCIFAFFGILCTYHLWILKALIPYKVIFTIPLKGGLSFKIDSGVSYNVLLGESQHLVYTGMVLIGSTLALWTATFCLLREKQV